MRTTAIIVALTAVLFFRESKAQDFDFSPTTGPLHGGTIITLTSDKFKNNVARIPDISVGHVKLECSFNSNVSSILCKTPSIKSEHSDLITINFLEKSWPSSKSSDPLRSGANFTFVHPAILRISLNVDQRNHNLNIYASGQNLTCGNRQTFKFWDTTVLC